jgi:glycosyltransferase involved in cell wall biosynthesis
MALKVLYVVEATIAGVRRHVTQLACGLDRQRFEATVACPLLRDRAYGDEQFVADLRAADVAVVPLSVRRAIHPRSDAAALKQLIQHLRAGRYDIVHAHSSKAGFLARLAARLADRPGTVYTPHGLYFLGLRSAAQRRFYLTLEQFAARLTDRIVAVSPGEREVLLRYRIARPEQIVWIANGISPARLPDAYDRAATRRALGQETDGLLIGSVARLSAQKNPFMFVDAAAQVLRNLPDARFVWCGGGELAAAAQQRADDLGMAHAVRWLGHREDAMEVLAALDVFWLCSTYEGAPYVLLEAMAQRVPIVATDVVGSRDMLREGNGLLVPSGDAAALGRATLMLAAQPERHAALAGAGWRWYAEHGSVQRMIAQTEQLYVELAARRSGVQSGVTPLHF